MNEEVLRARISVLVEQKAKAEQLLIDLKDDVLTLSGAIQESTGWLECLLSTNQLEHEAKERERAKKIRQRKKTTATVARDDQTAHQGTTNDQDAVTETEMQSEAA